MSESSPVAAGGPELMSVTEAAVMLRLSRMTILRRLKSESWPGGRSGRKYLLSRPFVVALAAEMGSGTCVVAEDFAAAWMARGASEAVALCPSARRQSAPAAERSTTSATVTHAAGAAHPPSSPRCPLFIP